MTTSKLMWPATLLMAAVVMVLSTQSVSARSAEGLSMMEKLLASSAAGASSSSSSSSSSPSSSESAAPLALAGNLGLKKRAVLDESCKGIYDRSLFQKLEKVCDDCYNLYRKPYVGIECRTNCYGNRIFRQCLDDLLMGDIADEFINTVQLVGK